MRILLIVLILGIAVCTHAQEYVHNAEIETEVNEQVWKPFKEAYEIRDWKVFNDLHTDDVLRISKWGGIKIGEAYKNRVKTSYQRNTQRKKTIDFWFEYRIYSEEVGYEVGYYRVVNEEPGQEPRTSYAQFHVVLRKEGGNWKIAQDWDTGVINGEKLTAIDFEKGTPIVF